MSRRHHSLLHQVRETKQENDEQEIQQVQQETKITTAHVSREQPGNKVLLATAQVKVQSNNGDMHILRALIDQVSGASFVSARVVELLGMTKSNISNVISGVGEGTKIQIKHLVNLSVSSRCHSNESVCHEENINNTAFQTHHGELPRA